MRISDWSSDVCSSDLIPGGLKNAIDWASRPYGTNAFTRKPSAVIGASIGAHRHGGRATEPEERPELLQLTPDERARGLYPVHARHDHRRGRSDGRVDRGLPAQLHGRIPCVRRPRLDGPSAWGVRDRKST